MASRSAKPTEASSSELYSFIGAASGYLIAGPLLILLNNRILNDVGFPFPIALSAMGVAFAAGTSRLMFASGLLSYSHLPAVYASHGVSSWRFYFSTALPIGALSALTLALGNASYVHLSVAMCTMLKATTPAMTFVLLFAFRIETPTVYEALCVLVITLGTIVATRGDLALSRLGVAMQLGANAAEALRLVLSQWLLANMKLPLFEMQVPALRPLRACHWNALWFSDMTSLLLTTLLSAALALAPRHAVPRGASAAALPHRERAGARDALGHRPRRRARRCRAAPVLLCRRGRPRAASPGGRTHRREGEERSSLDLP